MAYFVMLERADSRRPDSREVVAVNPDQIREVYPLNDGSCQLYFAGTNDEEGPTRVKGTLEQVLHKLRECGS